MEVEFSTCTSCCHSCSSLGRSQPCQIKITNKTGPPESVLHYIKCDCSLIVGSASLPEKNETLSAHQQNTNTQSLPETCGRCHRGRCFIDLHYDHVHGAWVPKGAHPHGIGGGGPRWPRWRPGPRSPPGRGAGAWRPAPAWRSGPPPGGSTAAGGRRCGRRRPAARAPARGRGRGAESGPGRTGPGSRQIGIGSNFHGQLV